MVQVSVTELGLLRGQVPPGVTIATIAIDFQVPGSLLQCIRPLGTSAEIPGSYRSQVRIGCPPGLSLVFDNIAASSHFNQYCDSEDNITCFHFRNVFIPVFRVFDEATGRNSVYTGLYTLRLLAGGERLAEMTAYNDSNIDRGVWSIVDPYAEYVLSSQSRLRWVCTTLSPCGEILPVRSGATPGFFFLLEASNVGLMENETYCELSVQFTIDLQGMPLGAITSIIVLAVSIFIVVVVVLIVFCLWCCRESFSSCKSMVWGWVWIQWRRRRSRTWLIAALKKNVRTYSTTSSLRRSIPSGSNPAIKGPLPYLKLPDDESTSSES